MGIVNKQIITCTVEITQNTPQMPSLNQCKPLYVNPKEKIFLKTSKHVKPSIAMSLCASTIYRAEATAPITIPMTSNEKKKSGQNQPYRTV